MIYYLKYDMQSICKRLVQEQLKNSGLKYNLLNTNELAFNQVVTDDLICSLNSALGKLGIEIVSSKKTMLVQKIKEAILELVSLEDKMVLSKTSHYLSKTLNHGYRYLASIFSEITHTTIENYIILQKIEKAKEMIATGELTFTEISLKLNYSSVAHFSTQFKNTTGLTPSLFKKIINGRRKNLIQANAS
jgi:AraC-like DNA-binding protein